MGPSMATLSFKPVLLSTASTLLIPCSAPLLPSSQFHLSFRTTNSEILYVPYNTDPMPYDPKYSPLFVTWSVRSTRPGRASRLRGCIGNFEAMPLHDGLAEYALISAFRDSRFNKIEEWELDSLECE